MKKLVKFLMNDSNNVLLLLTVSVLCTFYSLVVVAYCVVLKSELQAPTFGVIVRTVIIAGVLAFGGLVCYKSIYVLIDEIKEAK